MLGNVKVEITLQILDLVEGMILKWVVNNITVHLKWNVRLCVCWIQLSRDSVHKRTVVRTERTDVFQEI